jgi:integrase/recombinase XerD
LNLSLSYLSQVINGKRPLNAKLLSNSSFKILLNTKQNVKRRYVKNVNNSTEYLDLWQSELEVIKSLSRDTIASYRQKVEALLEVNPTPNELIVKAYLAKIKQSGACSGTIGNYVKAFRSFFHYLLDNGLYDFDISRLKLPKIQYRERRVPKDEEIATLVDSLESAEDTIALLLLVDCGIRVSELATIKLNHIDFNDASILINGKGNKIRTVYISETTLKYLRDYVQTIKGEYLFPSTRADARIEYRGRRYFERRLSELCERAGVERLTPHQLRHYFATSALSHGADVKAVSQFLGHADVTITLKIYHHVTTKAIREMHREYSPIANTRLALPRAIRS